MLSADAGWERCFKLSYSGLSFLSLYFLSLGRRLDTRWTHCNLVDCDVKPNTTDKRTCMCTITELILYEKNR